MRLYEFADGLFVVDAIDRPDLVGARVESIGGVPVDEVRALVEPLVPRDNESSLTARVPQFLLVAEVLHGLGVTISADEAELELVSPGGRRRASRWSRCRPPPTARRSPISSTRSFRRASPPGPSLRTSHGASRSAGCRRWTEAGSSTSPTTSPSGAPPTSRTSSVVRPAAPGWSASCSTCATTRAGTTRPMGRCWTSSSPWRISSCSSGARRSPPRPTSSPSSRSAPILVGEPSGGANLYGDTIAVALPESGWSAQIAAVHWAPAGEDPRLAFEPDVPVELTSADFFAGRDPVLSAALRRAPR